MTIGSRISWEPLRSRDSTTFVGTFQTLGTPLANPAYKVKLVNNSTVLVTVSIDGTNAIDVAPAGSFWLYDEGEQCPDGGRPQILQGTQFYVSGAAGTGSVYLVVQYIAG